MRTNKSKQTYDSKRPAAILSGLANLDKKNYDSKFQMFFKGYLNSNHSFFINSYFQAILIVKEIINSVKLHSDEEANIFVK